MLEVIFPPDFQPNPEGLSQYEKYHRFGELICLNINRVSNAAGLPNIEDLNFLDDEAKMQYATFIMQFSTSSNQN